MDTIHLPNITGDCGSKPILHKVGHAKHLRFIYISSDGDLDRDIGWWYQFVDTGKGAVDDLGEIGIDAVTDHEVDQYLGAIGKWGNREPEG